jgi:hypothetical protein
MRKMTGILGLTLLVVLLSPSLSGALWPEEKKPATAGEAAKEYAKEAVRDAKDATANVGETIKQTANAAYGTTADAAKSVTGGRKDTGGTGAAYRDSAGRYVEDTYSATRDRAAGAADSVRDAASRGAQTMTGGRQDHDSAGRTGAAYRDATGKYVADSASTTKEKAAGAAEAVKETASKASQTVADTARAAGEKASNAATATKGAAVDTAQAARDKAAQAYDASAETLGATTNKAADTAGSTRDRVWGKPESEKTYTEKARDMAARTGETVQDHASYAGGKLSESAQAAADAARRTGEATRDTAYRTAGYEAPSDRSYASRAYDASSDAYEAGRDKLGNIIETMGWRRAADGHHTGNSPYDVMVGNTKYVWHQRPENDDSYYQKAKDTLGGVADTASEKANQAKNAVYDSTGRATDDSYTGRAKDVMNRATDSVKGMTEQSGKTASDYSQRGKEALGAAGAAIGTNELVKTPKKERVNRVLRFLHLLAYAVTYGSAIWMTFISGRILSRTIPREQFRTVQTRMFPYFLKFMVAGEALVALLSTIASHSSPKWSIPAFLFLIAATAFNAFVLEPKTTKIYLERLRLEKEEGRGIDSASMAEKQQKFNEVHGFSALLNLLSVLGLTYHGWNMVPSLSA